MEWIQLLIDRHPRRALVVGKSTLIAGGVAVLAAVFARGQLMSLNADRLAGQLPPLRTLAEAFPQYPTWFVPEGPVGFVVSGLLVLAGTAVTVWADKALKRR